MVQGLDVNFQVDAPLTDGVATENWESLVRRITGRIVLKAELLPTDRILPEVPGLERGCRM